MLQSRGEKTMLRQYKGTPFVCHMCTKRNKMECATFDYAVLNKRVAPSATAVGRRAQPDAAVAPAASGDAETEYVLIRRLLERLKHLEQDSEQLTAKLSTY